MLRTGAGPSKTVEFDFDLAADTAYSVASEMVSDLSLSHDDAKVSGSSLFHTQPFCTKHVMPISSSTLPLAVCRLTLQRLIGFLVACR